MSDTTSTDPWADISTSWGDDGWDTFRSAVQGGATPDAAAALPGSVGVIPPAPRVAFEW